ncbi:MAG: hypothetical protein GY771_02320 [bacterium]|nr:hypothetical protein [bacterium]
MRNAVLFLAILVIAAPAVRGGEKEKFSEYYYSAKNVISELGAIAADIEKAKPSKGISPALTKPLKEELAKAREGLESIIANSDAAKVINEGYILYIDRMTIALSISEDYYETKDKPTRTKLVNALDDAEKQKTEVDAEWSANRNKYGFK